MSAVRRLAPAAALLAAAAAALLAYRELPGRPFAADDYQWLLSVVGLGPGGLVLSALDPGTQRHFYRPMVWALIWGEVRLFGLSPAGFHAVSLALHMLNAGLAGLLALRLAPGRPLAAAAGAAAALLHPAPYEAVAWVSAQSELLGAALLLGALLLWLGPRPRPLAATLLLALAMLTKESAALGLLLMAALAGGDPAGPPRRAYLAPAALTAAFAALQLWAERSNRVLLAGEYGLGPQLAANPLRSLALLAAPLPGSEFGDGAWLVPAGAVVLLALLALLALDRGGRPWPGAATPRRRAALALLLSLAPTAPFASPPDSRYLYLPALLASALLALWLARLAEIAPRRAPRLAAALLALALISAGAWSAGELAGREARFAARSGPGGSLWRLASRICADVHPRRMVLVDPPVAPEHADAIVRLACGDGTRAVAVTPEGVAAAAREGSVVIVFPGGSATVERWV